MTLFGITISITAELLGAVLACMGLVLGMAGAILSWATKGTSETDNNDAGIDSDAKEAAQAFLHYGGLAVAVVGVALISPWHLLLSGSALLLFLFLMVIGFILVNLISPPIRRWVCDSSGKYSLKRLAGRGRPALSSTEGDQQQPLQPHAPED